MAGPGMVAVKVVLTVALICTIQSADALPCSTVATDLYPCLNYAQYGGTLPEACCQGIRTLYNAAATPPDRRDVCNCMKNAAGSIPGINLSLVEGLPAKCRVNIPYKITPSIDCNKVH